jgi:hypothetical protein
MYPGAGGTEPTCPIDRPFQDRTSLPVPMRYEEMDSGEIKHALRGYSPHVQKKHVWPARDSGDTANPSYPPYGQRFRLKASFDTSGYSRDERVILEALKKYGYMVADLGTQFYVSTDNNPKDGRWTVNGMNGHFSGVKGTDFEAVNAAVLMIDENSGQARTQESVGF